MDIVLVVLHVSFFVPVLVRLGGRKVAAAGDVPGVITEVAAGARYPALIVHGAGLVLLWAGIVLALVQGRVSRAVTARAVLGAVVLLCAVLLIAWSIGALRSWRLLPTVGAAHELCTTGPYGFVRHPMYLAINLLAVGSLVWVPTPLVITGTLLLIVGGDLRARLEERVLLEAFGERYRRYMRRVRRTVPDVY